MINMKHIYSALLFAQQQIHFCLLFIPWPVSKETFVFLQEREPEMIDMDNEPSPEYELYRRRINKNIIDFGRIFSTQLNKIRKAVENDSPELAYQIGSVIEIGKEFQRALWFDLERLQMMDGHSTWREREAAELSELMQRRLYRLQNPNDCNLARKAIVSLRKGGFGCQLHSFVYKFIVAYATNRTMILDSQTWCYNGGWNLVFSPFSDTCSELNTSSRSAWRPITDYGNLSRMHEQILYFRSFPILPLSPFFPPTLPTDLSPRLKRLHGNPFAWWVGQFLKYILRPRSEMAKMVEEIAERRKFRKPIVGVHIRRSDKFLGGYPSYYSIDEYVAAAEEYFQVLELYENVPIRSIYLATDDPEVIREFKNKYENRYQIFSDSVVAYTASKYKYRCNNESLMGIVLDIFFLSLSDYLVCTFSSNVCRTAYEIMQIFYPDASSKAYSLDKSYFYGFELQGSLIAEYPHYARNPGDLRFDVGDKVTDVIDFESGYSTGVNRRLRQAGWYPSFKVHEVWNTYDFPTYPDSR